MPDIDIPTFRHSDIPTFRHSDIPTFRHSDIPTSRVGRPLFFISVPLEKRFGHRTITHSLIGVGILAALASPLYFFWPLGFWAVLGGYWSHIQIDMANIRGVALFWPSPIRVVMPGKMD